MLDEKPQAKENVMKSAICLTCFVVGLACSITITTSTVNAQQCPTQWSEWRYPYNTVLIDRTVNFIAANNGTQEDYDSNTDMVLHDGPTNDNLGNYHNVVFEEHMLGWPPYMAYATSYSNGDECYSYIGDTPRGKVSCTGEKTADYGIVTYNRNLFFLPGNGVWGGVCRYLANNELQCVTETKDLISRHELGHIFELSHTDGVISVMNTNPIRSWIQDITRQWYYTLRAYEISVLNCWY